MTDSFQTLAEAVPFAIWTSPSGEPCEISRQREVERLLGPGWSGRIHPDDAERCLGGIGSAMAARRPFQLECRVRRGGGEVRRVLFAGIPCFTDSGAFSGYVGCAADLTGFCRPEESPLESERAALTASEQTCRTLLECMSQGVVCRDREGRIVFTNPAARRLLGCPPPNVALFDAAGNELSPDDWPSAVAARLGRPVEGVLARAVDRDTGKETWVDIDAVPLFQAGEDRPSHVYTFVQDVTGRESSRRILQEQAGLLDIVFDSLPVLVGLIDETGRLVQVNRQWMGLLGPADTESSRALYASIQGEMNWTETILTRAGGGSIDASCARVPLPDGRALVIGRDVTRPKAAERMLRASEERFRALVENASEIIFLIDAAATIRYVSPGSARAAGFDPEAILGTNALEPVHPDDLDSVKRALGAALATPLTCITIDVRVRRPGGDWRVWEDRITNMLDVKGVEGIVVNRRDVTDRRQMESEIRDSRDRLRRLAAHIESVREQERTRISREVHDELGQMLTALKMELQTLGLKAARQGRAGDMLARIDAMCEHIDMTIDSVRRISAELRPGLLDHLGLGAAIEWQAAEFQRQCGIACTIQREDADSESRLAPERATGVFRIFQEVLTNVARHADARKVQIRVAESHDWLTLDVRDDGRGFDPREMAECGSLGLLGMRERAALMGGTLEISGAPGAGTAVRVRVPLGD